MNNRKHRSINELHELHDDALLDSTEAASYILITRNSLAVRRVRGQEPAYLQNGRLIRYKKGTLDTFMLGDSETAQVATNG